MSLRLIDQNFIMYEKSDHRKVKGIGDHLIDIKGISTLPIQIRNNLFNQKFDISDNSTHPFLLGIDFLKANNCSLNFESQTFNTEEGEPVVNVIESDFKLGLARPVKHTVISTKSEIMISKSIKSST